MTPAHQRLLAGLILGGAAFAALRRPRTRVECSPDELAGLTYLTRYAGGAKPDQALPLVVFLHSRGAKPSGFTSFVNRVKVPARVLFPGGPHVKSGRHSWATVGARGDQERLAADLKASAAQLSDFITAAEQCFPTVGRPVVTGTSQGGNMAYAIASQYPDSVRGAVALAGWLPESMWNARMARTYAAHGKYDATVPYDRTAGYWQAMQGRGADLETRTYNVGHTTSGMGPWWGARVTELVGGAVA